MSKKGFYNHLYEATVKNRQRKTEYALMTNGKSKRVSNLLIFSETIGMPIAKIFDFLALKYNRRGIGIVQNDFVSMHKTNEIAEPPKYKNSATKQIFRQLRNEVKSYKRSLKPYLKSANFKKIAEKSSKMLFVIKKMEQTEKVHFIMIKHLVESTGFIALNSIKYSVQSDNKTDVLTKNLIRLHLFSMSYALLIDKEAQKIHKTGVGIVVNDVPDIPFCAGE